MEQFDLIVIGAGPGGYVGAIEAANMGKKVAVVERRQVGGTCLNRGCIPTKALLRASRVYREAKEGESLGITVSGASYDMNAMHQRVVQVTDTLRGGIEALFKKGKITLLQGTGRIEREGVVSVDGVEYGADHILLAVGSKPARIPIPGLDLPGVVTSDEMLEGVVECRHLAIIGGGVIGVEFAQVYSDLGCQVTIIEALPRILNNMDKEISQNMTMILKKRGVPVHVGCAVTEVAAEDGQLVCRFTEKDQPAEVKADRVLVCTGRRPETQGVFAEGVGPELTRGYVTVDEHYATSMPGVYAVGDIVAGGVQLAHAAESEAKNAVHHMFGEGLDKDISVIPGCVFTDPEIATAGITQDEAKAAGRAVYVKKSLTSANGKSVVEGAERGFAKLVFDSETHKLVGAHIMCPHASEMIGGLTAAIVGGLTEEQLGAAVFPHPTVSEILSVE